MSEVRLSPMGRPLHDDLQRAIELGYSRDAQWLAAQVDTRRYSVIVTRDNIGEPSRLTVPPDWRWHISVAGERDVPRWSDLVTIAHKVRPGTVFVVGVPPRSWWINVHPHCLHLWELIDPALTAQWHSEAQGHEPT